MSEDKLETAITRGVRAEALLKNELLAEAFARLEADYTQAWRLTAARDTEARERLWQAVQVVGKARDHLVSVASNGKLAKRELDQLVERRKRFGIL